MSDFDKQANALAARFIDEGHATKATYPVLLTALLRAYVAIAENFPHGIAEPALRLREGARVLEENDERARRAVAARNQFHLFH